MNYSDYCYTCIFDDEFNIVWTDNYGLFRRLARHHEKIKKMLFGYKGLPDSIYYTLTAEGDKYTVKIDLLVDRRIICRASKDIPDNVIGNDELQKELELIRNNSMNAIYSAQLLNDRRAESDSVFFRDSINAQVQLMAAVSSECANILQLFDNRSERFFVPLEKFLIRLFDRMNFSLRNIRKDVSYCFFVDEPYWKIDCKNFELAIFSIVKLILMLTTFGNGGMIMITTTENANINVSAEFSYQQNYALKNCCAEIRTLRHVFELMSGDVDFFQEGKTIVLEGRIRSEYTYDEENVDHYYRYMLNVTSELISARRKNKDKYYELYKNRSDDGQLKSPVLELQNITDPTLAWWSLVFESAAELEM